MQKKESNIRNPGYFVFAKTSMCWKHYMFMGQECLRKRNSLDSLKLQSHCHVSRPTFYYVSET